MRVFYAVNFPDYIKEALDGSLGEIQKHTLKGSFTEKENFHVTLVFVGECEAAMTEVLIEAADSAVAKLSPPQIKAKIEGLATFARSGEELLWAGVSAEPENILYKINKALIGELEAAGIKIKDGDKKFTPHVTMARKVEFWRISGKDVRQIKFPALNFTVNSITLMESLQEVKLYGDKKYTKVTYRPIYECKF
jgi:2'-5' RNA ligase